MLAKEADQLKRGDRVLAYNGPYTQDAQVVKVTKDHRNVRWIEYHWQSPNGSHHFGMKRHNSVYLPENS